MKTKEEIERLKKLDLKDLNTEIINLNKKWRELISKSTDNKRFKSDYQFIKKTKARVLTFINNKK